MVFTLRVGGLSPFILLGVERFQVLSATSTSFPAQQPMGNREPGMDRGLWFLPRLLFLFQLCFLPGDLSSG